MKRHVPLVLTLLLAALGARAEEPESAAGGLTLHHGWASPGEMAAVDSLVGIFRKAYPDVAVRHFNTDGRGRMFTIVRNGQSDAFATQAGSTLGPFLDADVIANVDDVWTAEGLDKVLPPVLQKINRRDGHHYSIPLAVHRTNLVWYNKTLLDKHKIDPATLTTWDSFFKAADTLRAAGVKNPIQMGLAWTCATVFEGIMVGEGRAAYEAWINGKMREGDNPRGIEAFTTFKKYLDYVNDDHATTGWDVALKRVIGGQSAFITMGDWAEGEFQVAGLKYGKDYGAMPVPGTQGVYVLMVDSFVRPKRRPHELRSDRWLRIVASRDGQDAFNTVKGSIAARTDADVTKYGAYQRSAIADMKAARALYPNHDVVEPEAFKVKQTDLLAAFTIDRDVKKATQALAMAAVQTEKHFTEPWSLTQP